MVQSSILEQGEQGQFLSQKYMNYTEGTASIEEGSTGSDVTGRSLGNS